MKKIHWFTVPDTTQLSQTSCTITDSEVINQIQKVLRLQTGERVVLKSSTRAFEGTLDEVTKFRVTLTDIKEIAQNIPSKRISLFVCIPKKDKFELIIEKCTEIGVTDFYPVVSDRTIKTNINMDRSLKIIQEASEQSQRTDTPTLHEIQSLEDIINEYRPVVFDVEGEEFTKENSKNIHNILIGPEGGYSEKELQIFKDKNLDIYKVGNTILKTETAAIVISGILLN